MNQAIKSKILANPYTFPENGINVNLKLILRDLCVDIVYLRKMSESEWAFKNDAKKVNRIVVTIPCKFYWNDPFKASALLRIERSGFVRFIEKPFEINVGNEFTES